MAMSSIPPQTKRLRLTLGPVCDIALLVCMCALVAGRGTVETWLNLEPVGDQSSYLGLAANVADGRGFRALGLHPMSLDRGYDSPEAVRHPLYPYVLAQFARRSAAGRATFFPRAKAVSLAILCLAPLVIYGSARWLFGGATALMAAFFTTVNLPLFHYYSTTVVCEGLLLVTLSPAVLLLARGFRRPQWWLVGAVCLGLAFLTKGTAALVAAGLVVALLQRKASWRDPWLWASTAVGLLVVSPYLLRNMAEFGSPLFSYNDNIMWLDKWRHFYRPYAAGALPSFSTYAEQHTLAEALARFWDGACWQLEYIGVALSPSTSLPLVKSYGLMRLVCGAYMALAALGLALRPCRGERVFVAASAGLFFAAFAWYRPIVVTTARFYFPLAPVVYVYAASVTVRLLHACCGRRYAGWLLRGAMAVLLLWVCADLVGARRRLGPRSFADASRPAQATFELLTWLDRNAQPDDVICYGPERPIYTWWTKRRWTFMPVDETLMPLSEFLHKHHVRFAIVDGQALARRPYLAKHFTVDDEGRCSRLPSLKQAYPGLRPVFSGRAREPFLCFEVEGATPTGK